MYTGLQLAETVDSEGLGYAIEHYVDPNEVPEEIKERWLTALKTINDIREYLSQWSVEGDDL